MKKESLIKGPNVFHPEKPGAVGSRNSISRNGRNEYVEGKQIVDEEVDKMVNHINAKMPPEVLEKLDVMGGVKSKLHNYYNQGFQNMYNRYLTTVEDELAKKFRDLVDIEENRGLNKYTPRAISEILDKIGGVDKFNTGELEKSLVNIYGHLHGHIQRGVTDIEQDTNTLLRQKTDVGAFVRGENSYAVAKCSFKNNFYKPKTVMDIKLAINVLDSELISPIHHYQEPLQKMVKTIVSDHIHSLIDKQIEKLKLALLDEGKEEMSDVETIYERFKLLEKHVDDEEGNDQSKRYQQVAKKFFDAIEGVTAEIPVNEFDTLRMRENVKRIMDNENIRNRGFNTAVNGITSILDWSKMGYQYINNLKNARACHIREYESTKLEELPDETYKINMTYFDQAQLIGMREAYALQAKELENEIEKTMQVVDVLYEQNKKNMNIKDFKDIANHYLNPSSEKKKGFFGKKEILEEERVLEEEDKLWNEIVFVTPDEKAVENKTFKYFITEMKMKMIKMKEVLAEVFKNQNPDARLIVQDRIAFLEKSFLEFSGMINPFHVQPGLILEIDIITVKRKKTTMMSMANVLNEFLYAISKGFSDAAFAGFSRRRSTVRSDIDQAFESIEEKIVDDNPVEETVGEEMSIDSAL